MIVHIEPQVWRSARKSPLKTYGKGLLVPMRFGRLWYSSPMDGLWKCLTSWARRGVCWGPWYIDIDFDRKVKQPWREHAGSVLVVIFVLPIPVAKCSPGSEHRHRRRGCLSLGSWASYISWRSQRVGWPMWRSTCPATSHTRRVLCPGRVVIIIIPQQLLPAGHQPLLSELPGGAASLWPVSQNSYPFGRPRSTLWFISLFLLLISLLHCYLSILWISRSSCSPERD